MQFGWTANEQTSFEIMDAFAEAGGNLIDTADIYTTWKQEGDNPGGISEEIIGRWMKSRGNRDQVVVATKVRGAMGLLGSQGRDSIYQREGLSRQWIMRAVEDSMRRLQVDYIDLYQVHTIDSHVPIEETLSALTDLVRRGYVRYIGCSNFSAWRLMQALWASDKQGFERFVSIQPEYSLTQPTRANFERELAPVVQTYGLGVIPYSPLSAGFLTGKYRRDQALPQTVRAQTVADRKYNDQNWNILDKLLAVAGHRHPAQVALAWLLSKPYMSAPIVGANSVGQLNDLLPAANLSLSPDEIKALDEVSDWPRSRTEREI